MRPETAARLYDALKSIASYDSPEGLRRAAGPVYGLGAEEAIEMAYENAIEEARAAIRGVRRPATARPPARAVVGYRQIPDSDGGL